MLIKTADLLDSHKIMPIAKSEKDGSTNLPRTEGTIGHLSIMECARYRIQIWGVVSIQIRGIVNTCSVINPETKYNYCTSELFAFTFRYIAALHP
jgi:hypothetical protein